MTVYGENAHPAVVVHSTNSALFDRASRYAHTIRAFGGPIRWLDWDVLITDIHHSVSAEVMSAFRCGRPWWFGVFGGRGAVSPHRRNFSTDASSASHSDGTSLRTVDGTAASSMRDADALLRHNEHESKGRTG